MTAALLVVAAAGACSGDPQPDVATTSSAAAAGREQPKPVAHSDESIGVATMDRDGTIVLQLRAEGPAGLVGDAQLRYPPSHEQYSEVLTHLGGLEPGASKRVPPWP
jgi:hypothetical protein